MGCQKMYNEKKVTYILRKVKREDVTRVNHGQKQSCSPPKKEAPKHVLSEESPKKIRPTHKLKQDRPQSESSEEWILKTRPIHPLKQDRPYLCDQKSEH